MTVKEGRDGTATMRIDGAWLCELLRGMVVEGRWAEARRIAETAFHSMAIDTVEAILSGKLELRSAGSSFEVLEAPASREAQMLEETRKTYQGWIDDRATRGDQQLGMHSLDEAEARLPHGWAWRLEQAGSGEELIDTEPGNPWIRSGRDGRYDLREVCLTRKVSMIAGMILRHSEDPWRARPSHFQEKLPQELGGPKPSDPHPERLTTLWATFLPAPRPITPPWWPDLLPSSEAEFWAGQLGWPEYPRISKKRSEEQQRAKKGERAMVNTAEAAGPDSENREDPVQRSAAANRETPAGELEDAWGEEDA